MTKQLQLNFWTINSQKILIIDLDVHQGNGTAEIFCKNPNVFTFSTHGRTNYPFKKKLLT
jgi:acetoin utilization deacetylase AcuC-like enzyme